MSVPYVRHYSPQINHQPVDFMASDEAAKRRRMRAAIRGMRGRKRTSGTITKSERLLLEAVLNLWWARKKGQPIHPGRAKLAEMVDCHPDTVTVALKKFSSLGWIEAVAYAKGGQNATRYMVHEAEILTDFTYVNDVKTVDGQLVEVTQTQVDGGENEQLCVISMRHEPPENPERFNTYVSTLVDVVKTNNHPSQEVPVGSVTFISNHLPPDKAKRIANRLDKVRKDRRNEKDRDRRLKRRQQAGLPLTRMQAMHMRPAASHDADPFDLPF